MKDKMKCPRCGKEFEIGLGINWCGIMSTWVCPHCGYPCDVCILYERCYEDELFDDCEEDEEDC